jgi:hypothetical protein
MRYLDRILARGAFALTLSFPGCTTGDSPAQPIEIVDPYGQLPAGAQSSSDGLSVTANAPSSLHRVYEPCPVPSAAYDADEPRPSVEVGAMAAVSGDLVGPATPYSAVRCR